jgi:hypothetical protein
VEQDNRTTEIEGLRNRLSEATARKAALLEELQELGARIHDIRAAFGNPFSYSHPEHADESAANDTGYSSHAVILPTFLALTRVEGEIRQMKGRLRGFGVVVD